MKTESNKLIIQACYLTKKTLTLKQTGYQNQIETRLTPVKITKQMKIYEIAIEIKEVINTLVKNVCSKSKITKTSKP